jgi:hypothetical protein
MNVKKWLKHQEERGLSQPPSKSNGSFHPNPLATANGSTVDTIPVKPTSFGKPLAELTPAEKKAEDEWWAYNAKKGGTAYSSSGEFFDHVYVSKCKHTGEVPVMIGGFPVHLAAGSSIPMELLSQVDYIYTLNGNLPCAWVDRDKLFGLELPTIVYAEMEDRGKIPDTWESFIHGVAERIRSGKKILAYCTGSHGRTGTFGASLIAVMEPDVEDPIGAIRERHCKESVESLHQADAIFSLKNYQETHNGEFLPDNYEKEFNKKTKWSNSGGGSYHPIGCSCNLCLKELKAESKAHTGGVAKDFESEAEYDAWWRAWGSADEKSREEMEAKALEQYGTHWPDYPYFDS